MARYIQLAGYHGLSGSGEEIIEQIKKLIAGGAKEISLDAEQMEALKGTLAAKEPSTWDKILGSLTDVAKMGLEYYFKKRMKGESTPVPQRSFNIPAGAFEKEEKPAVPTWVWGAGIGVVGLGVLGITAALLLKKK
jgi:hypothetical protein